MWPLLFILVSCKFEGGFQIALFLKSEVKVKCLRDALMVQFPMAKIEQEQKEFVTTFKLDYPGAKIPSWVTPGMIYHAGAKTLVMGYNASTKTFNKLAPEDQVVLRNALAPITYQFDSLPEQLIAQCGLQVIDNKTGRVCSQGICRSN